MRVLLFSLLISCCACAQISMTGAITTSNGTSLGAPRLIFGFGDSLTIGSLAVPALTNGYFGLITAFYGYEQHNFSVGGTNIGDWAQYQHQLGARTTSTGIAASIYGVNDVYQVNLQGKGPLDQTNWGRAAMANMLFGAVAYSENIRARDGAWTFGGTWINGNSGIAVYDNDGSKMTSTAASTGTVTVSGTAVYLVYLANQPSGDAGFSVTVDGISQGSFTDLGFAQSTLLQNYQYYPVALRFSGLSSGPHTLVVTYNSGTTPLIILWAVGNTLVNHPRYFVGNCPPEQNSANASDIASLNSTFSTVANQLNGDGLGLYPVDVHSAIDPANASLWGDVIHPSTAGHALIGAAFEAVMSAHP